MLTSRFRSVTFGARACLRENASNRLVNIENMTEDELKVIQQYYTRLSRITKNEESLQQSHSIDEANEMDKRKKHTEKNIQESIEKGVLQKV